MTLDQIYLPVKNELSQTQTLVARLWGEALALVHGPSSDAPKVGGKLLRPALCLLSAGASGGHDDLGRFVDLAAACELLHIAALTHDDIVDGSNLRRGAMSLNALWDDHTAVLSGDYLVARAVEILVSCNSVGLIANAFEAVRKMTEGELRSFSSNASAYTQQDCLKLAEDKTATYFSATCTAPTYLLNSDCRSALHEYGLSLGIAFQLIDDILDLTQNTETLGKPSCGDIAEGKKTVPILYMREGLPQADAERLVKMLGNPIDDADRLWVSEALDRSGARARTEQLARSYADAARGALKAVPESPFKDSMLGMAEFVLVRGS